MTIDELIAAWNVNNEINLDLLDLCGDELLELKPIKGKTIRSNFVHIAGVRAQWILEKPPAGSSPIPKLDWKSASRDEIRKGLLTTCDLMEGRFRRLEASGKPLLKHFAYCIAHEANHRSQIEIALRINGHEPDANALFGLWN